MNNAKRFSSGWSLRPFSRTRINEDDLSPWYADRLRHLHRKTLNLATLTFGHEDRDLWNHSGPRWAQEGPVTGRPWCASDLDYGVDGSEYEVTFWIQMGWWEKPKVFQMREASHKAALERLFDDWEASRSTFRLR